MREPISFWQSRFPDGKVPAPLLKVYVRFILHGLDYLHSECEVVHTGQFLVPVQHCDLADARTDLTPANIMMSFEDNSVLPEYVKNLGRKPVARKAVGDRTIYQSQPEFGLLKDIWSCPQIHDFGHAEVMEPGLGFRHPSQPNLYRAPEVMLGVVWDYNVDIWNLGVLVSIPRESGSVPLLTRA